MMRLGLTASSGSAATARACRTAGQAFYNGPDQAVKRGLGEWKNGLTTTRSAIGQQWNNVDGDPTRARLGQHYGRVGPLLNKALWPNLAVTYSQNALNSTLDTTGIAHRK